MQNRREQGDGQGLVLAMPSGTRQRRLMLSAWEPYLTGQREAEAKGASWVCEQLSLYGLGQGETRSPAKGWRARSGQGKPSGAKPASLRPPEAQAVLPPPLDWARRKGVSLLVVKEVLGHTSLSTTERYLHLLRETMCRELEAHPL